MRNESSISLDEQPLPTPGEQPKLVAVIDIGATSVRMAIAEIGQGNSIRYIEQLSQAVSLGKDSFIKGYIEKTTIEDCVRVLQIYRQKLNEYEIDDSRDIRVVATSAVREASNRLAFQDRVFIATGLEIEPFDEAELHRVTYVSVLPFLNNQLYLDNDHTLVCEIGGGTTEVIGFHKKNVAFSKTFRLGALRLRKRVQALEASSSKARSMMESHIDQMIDQIRTEFGEYQFDIVGMGGELRFVATRILKRQLANILVPIPQAELRIFAEEVLETSPDRLARKYHLSIPEAESFGPALLTQLKILESFGANEIYVANTNLRDGLIKEIALGRSWTDEISEQIVGSAMALANKYHVDLDHAKQVAKFTRSLFDQLQSVHKLEDRYRTLLYIAALLHEVGLFVGSRSYHKHTMYLIRQSEFFGVGVQDLLLVALIARYHRRAFPQPGHEGYSSLERKDRVIVAKLSAILRIAKALDSSRDQHIKKIKCEIKPGRINLLAPQAVDLSLEQLELRQAAVMFEDVFGLAVDLVQRAP